MAAMQCSTRARAAISVSRSTFVPHHCGRPPRAVVVSSHQSEAPTSRREALLLSSAVSLTTLLSVAAPAQAFLGIGDDTTQKDYETETGAILAKVRSTLAIPKDDPEKDETVKGLRKDINSWVAKYRREPKVSGRPSFGNTYSALNTLAGHYNSFGVQAPVPKKRLERLNKELDDASLFLSRNR